MSGTPKGTGARSVARSGSPCDPLGVHPAEGGEEPQVEGPLLLRRAEEEVAARHLERPGGVVVAVGVEPQRLDVGEVLDQPGIVEVDRHRQAGHLEDAGRSRAAPGPRRRRNPRGSPPAAPARSGGPPPRRARRAPPSPPAPRARPEPRRPRGRQPPRELQIADADPRHQGPDRLAGEEGDAGHERTPSQPLMNPPGAGRLHLADDPVQALDLGIGAAEVGRLVVHGGAELPFVVVEPLHLGRAPLDLGAQGLALFPQGRQLAVGGVVALLPEEPFAGQLLVVAAEGGEVLARPGELVAQVGEVEAGAGPPLALGDQLGRAACRPPGPASRGGGDRRAWRAPGP